MRFEREKGVESLLERGGVVLWHGFLCKSTTVCTTVNEKVRGVYAGIGCSIRYCCCGDRLTIYFDACIINCILMCHRCLADVIDY